MPNPNHAATDAMVPQARAALAGPIFSRNAPSRH